jgi:indole-3-glycerol phosphate synthase
MSFLERIRPEKDAEVDALRGNPPDPSRGGPRRDFRAALLAPGMSAIAELKRRSPSRGDIRPGADPTDIARMYEANGAAALSVLTDGPHFGGSLSDFAAIRDAVSLPMLRKDFIVHELQLDEARAWGADAALLIVAMLDQPTLTRLHAHATALGLDVLVETHSADELARALDAGSTIVGVNSRNLHTMAIDLQTCVDLLPSLPEGVVRVAESGLKTPADVARMDADAILVGSSLMSAPDPGVALRELLCG